MSFVQRLQQANRFLDAVATGSLQSPLEQLHASFDVAELARYATSNGYETDAASLVEAFRIRMAARAAVRTNGTR